MKHSLIYFEPLKIWDKWTIAIYALLTILVYFACTGKIYFSDIRGLIFGYALGTHYFIYFFNYQSLRNMYVFLIWVIFGIIHLLGYLFLKNDPTLEMTKVHSAIGLRNTLILLFIFQMLRVISVNIQHQEFVALSKSKTDLFEGRKVTIVDFLIFVIYVAATMLLYISG